MITAAKPILTEAGTSAKITGKAINDGDELSSQPKEIQSTFYPGVCITNLFGLACFSTLLLNYVTLIIG